MRTGNRLVLLYGGNWPFLLSLTKGEHYYFVGRCYVQDIMHASCMARRSKNVRLARTRVECSRSDEGTFKVVLSNLSRFRTTFVCWLLCTFHGVDSVVRRLSPFHQLAPPRTAPLVVRPLHSSSAPAESRRHDHKCCRGDRKTLIPCLVRCRSLLLRCLDLRRSGQYVSLTHPSKRSEDGLPRHC